MTKIAIINAVPINGGDEALMEATLVGLKNHFINPTISIFCNKPTLYQNIFPELKLDWDWEYVYLKNPDNENDFVFKLKNLIRKSLKKIFKIKYDSKLSRVFASNSEKRVFAKLSNSHKVIVSAGGYIHDFYGYSKRLRTLDFIHEQLKIPYYIFSQSLGPFWEDKNYSKLCYTINNAAQVILRENFSLNHLKKIGYHCKNVTVTNDVAFYLNGTYSKKVKTDKKLKTIAVNFREWKYEEDSNGNFNKATALCKKLIAKNYKISFISTCQGVEGYVDDSLFAEKIMNSLTDVEKSYCKVYKNKLSLTDLIETLSNQDAYIGMRLHGAILSLLAGIPALNIAYEDKTLGIFNSLGIDDYCFHYKVDYSIWNQKTDYFIKNYNDYLHKVESITTKAKKDVTQNFKLLQ